MKHNERTFKTTDGVRLFEQSWRPDGDSKATVLLVHGYAEHSGRYNYAAKYLAGRGYAIYAFDLRGHGRSEGPRALVRSFDEYLADLKCFFDRVKKQEPKKSVFILGHSMGGTIAALFNILYKPRIRGLALSGALLKVHNRLSFLFRIFIFIIGSVFPKLPVIKRVDCRVISTDPDVAKRYDNDPLVYHGKLLAGEAREINLAINRIRRRVREISLPLLVMHGTADRLVNLQGSLYIYTRAASRDKTLKLYEGFYHEILNEPEKSRVLADLAAWLEAHFI